MYPVPSALQMSILAYWELDMFRSTVYRGKITTVANCTILHYYHVLGVYSTFMYWQNAAVLNCTIL
jgi:hypothetical protein